MKENLKKKNVVVRALKTKQFGNVFSLRGCLGKVLKWRKILGADRLLRPRVGRGAGVFRKVWCIKTSPPPNNYISKLYPPWQWQFLKCTPSPNPSWPSLFFHPWGIDFISYKIPVVGSVAWEFEASERRGRKFSVPQQKTFKFGVLEFPSHVFSKETV